MLKKSYLNITLLFFASLMLFIFSSCTKTSSKKEEIFPQELKNHKKQSESIERNQKKLNLSQLYNENGQLIEKIEATYDKNNILTRYKYKSPLYAFSEFSIAKDMNYPLYKKSPLAYLFDQTLVLLSNEYIYTISKPIIDLSSLHVQAQSKIKLPNHALTHNSEKLFINDDESFPFFKQYIKRDSQYEGIIIHTISPYQSKNIKALEDFIQKQEIQESTETFILFKVEEDERFLYNKESHMLFLNFTEDELKKIKMFKNSTK